MRQNYLYIFLLIILLATGLFSVNQIIYYFTGRQIVVGTWSSEGNEINEISFLNNEPYQAKVLGKQNSINEIAQARVEYKSFQGFLFDQYFKSNHSPLYGYGDDFVNACEKYGAPKDCTLLLAIAKVETNLCKTGLSYPQYNCWGWGGSGSNRIIFSNFEESIDTITRRLMEGYGRGFFENANNGGGLSYCGSHCTSWGFHVKSEQNYLRQYLKDNGVKF